MHLYCAKLEIDGEHFIDVYGSGHTPDGNPENKIYDGHLNAGYVVWSEFIAQYYTLIKTEKRRYSFADALEHIFDLLHEVTVTAANIDSSKGAFAQACAYWLTCRDTEETLEALNGPDYFISDNEEYGRETKAALCGCLAYLHEQTKREKPWKISEDFIETLGAKFNMYRVMNSFVLGVEINLD